MFNKNAQIAETMTWVVATIVIIVILTLSIFVVSSNPFKRFKKFELNKEADLLAMKSITSYLVEDSNLNLIKNSVRDNNYNALEEKFKPFLESLPIFNGVGAWNMELYVDGEEEFEIINRDTIGDFDYYTTNFEFEEDNRKIRLKFWEDCQGICQ